MPSNDPRQFPGRNRTAPVLILGAGINGSAIARELVLNGVSCWIVDRNDIAFGATSRSSRLIHGGLRYLEYGDFHLVRESLAERTILRSVAPQFVEPLKLYIPVSQRTGGLLQSGFRFLGASRSKTVSGLVSKFMGREARGLWLVRAGLTMYDSFASSDQFPKHQVYRVSKENTPRVDPAKYQWVCGYYDGQMRYPERFVVAMLEDARGLAAARQIDFRIFTHHHAVVGDSTVEIRSTSGTTASETCNPSIIVNATGAWGDLTLEQLPAASPRLFGPTKGSHFISHTPRFREALGNAGVYAEADDGRLIFVLPFGQSVLVGTTDERFDDDPARATATQPELEYLLEMVNDLFPGVQLTMDDVHVHYSGVRPLPAMEASTTSAVSRDHAIVSSKASSYEVLTLVGGKLTTARALGAITADDVFLRLAVTRVNSSTTRIVPGGEDYPMNPAEVQIACESLAKKHELDIAQVRTVWPLVGTRCDEILAAALSAAPVGNVDSRRSISGTNLPHGFVRWVIDHEWVATLDDLFDRRLMLLFEPQVTEATIRDLAGCMVEAGRLPADEQEVASAQTIERLKRDHGFRFSTN